MVLVDTSVWVRFFVDRPPFGADLQKMLTRGQVVGHDLVFGELLMGDPGGSRTLVSGYGHMPRATMVDHDNVVAFVRAHTLQGRGIGWIDVHLLASALVGHHQLWTANAALARVARELGVAY